MLFVPDPHSFVNIVDDFTRLQNLYSDAGTNNMDSAQTNLPTTGATTTHGGNTTNYTSTPPVNYNPELKFASAFADVIRGIRKAYSEAGDLLRKPEGVYSYQNNEFENTALKLIFGRLADGTAIWLGYTTSYFNVEQWMAAKDRKDAFRQLGVKEIYTEKLVFNPY